MIKNKNGIHHLNNTSKYCRYRLQNFFMYMLLQNGKYWQTTLWRIFGLCFSKNTTPSKLTNVSYWTIIIIPALKRFNLTINDKTNWLGLNRLYEQLINRQSTRCHMYYLFCRENSGQGWRHRLMALRIQFQRY